MKTYLTYGAAMAGTNLLLTFAFYFLDYHSDPEKLQTAGPIANFGPLIIAIIFIVLGTRARRAEIPATEEFGYGRALGAGVMIGLFGALIGVVTSFAYFQFINPGFTEVALRAQTMAMEAKNIPAAQIEAAQKIMRTMMQPAAMAIIGFVMGMVGCTVISLVTAAILNRKAAEEPLVQPPSTVA